MLYPILKFGITALMIVLISELSRWEIFKSNYTLVGAVLASLPTVTVFALLWKYYEGAPIEDLSRFSIGTFWFVIPSLSFLLILPFLLKYKVPFLPSMLLSLIVMGLMYLLMMQALKRFGISL